jgi:hypothetical protein
MHIIVIIIKIFMYSIYVKKNFSFFLVEAKRTNKDFLDSINNVNFNKLFFLIVVTNN